MVWTTLRGHWNERPRGNREVSRAQARADSRSDVLWSQTQEAEGLSIGSVDRDIGTAARVLEEAARKWRDDGTNLTWLIETPMIEYQREYNKRLPYPLDWEEQKLLFSELALHL